MTDPILILLYLTTANDLTFKGSKNFSSQIIHDDVIHDDGVGNRLRYKKGGA
jgi:hypothetical protein